MKVNPILKLEKGEKLGRNGKGEYEIYGNRYFQQTIRWWYKQDRQKTVEYLDEDFTNYMKFLDELCYYLSKDVLGVYTNFSQQVKEYNRDIERNLINCLSLLGNKYTFISTKILNNGHKLLP